MKEEELVKVYKESYKEQYDEFFHQFDKIYSKAIDKKYAIKFQLGIINLISGFFLNSELDKKILELHEHHIKLGGDIIDIINSIPDSVKHFKEEQKLIKEENENKVSIEWKRLFGIPYKIEKINATIKSEVGSTFEHLNLKDEIAKQLGKQRAIFDLREQIKGKFIEQGGLKELTGKQQDDIFPIKYKTVNNLKESLSKNDLVEFFKILQSVFATLSYDMKITEGYFHSHIHFALTFLDFDINSEVETNQGRIDSVIETKNYIHIIEFKQDNSDIALEQIINKKYYQKYLTKNKKIILVGVAVDKNQKNIIDWKMKTYE